jgi:hypothetical protein
MNLTFLVLAHADPSMLARLCRALAPFPVIVHLDAKANAGEFGPVVDDSRVLFVENRVKVHWGGWSVVEATLRLIEAALAMRTSPDWLVLLSGACFPTKPPRELSAYLAGSAQRCLVRAARLHDAGAWQYSRVSRYWWFDSFDIPAGRYNWATIPRLSTRKAMELATYPFRKRPAEAAPGVILAVGSQWWAMDNACARHVLATFRERSDLVRFFRTSFAPDEIAIQSVIHSSDTLEGVGHIEPWPETGIAGLTNLHFVDPGLAKIFKDDDFERIVQADRWFVRKVDSRRSAGLLDRIERDRLGLVQGQAGARGGPLPGRDLSSPT